MQGPGYWGNHYWQPNYWPDNYWYERELGTGEPYFVFYANKSFLFNAMKVFTFPAAVHAYVFNALKLFIYPVRERSYIFSPRKTFIFQATGGMTTPSYFEKLPSETFTIAVEWANQLPFGATLSTGVVAALKMDDQSNASATVLANGTSATISGTQSRIKVNGGKVHTKYRIMFTVTLSNGEVLQEAVYMQIREP